MPRPRLNPTDEQRRLVKSLAAMNIKQEDIARMVNIRSPKTLRRHFRGELDRGATEATYKVASALFQKALAGDTAAMIFWLKTRADWRERKEFDRSAIAPPPFVVGVIQENK